MSVDRSNVIKACLDDVDEELRAFNALFQAKNRFAVFHLEQAAEKLMRAVRIHRGLIVTNTHELALMIDGHPGDDTREPKPLPAGDVWRDRMRQHESLSRYATSYRYPTDAGRIKSAPSDEELREQERRLTEHLGMARTELLAP